MPEIIAPASTPGKISLYSDAGAGMFYAGIKGFCRKERDGVGLPEAGELCRAAHSKGAKFFAAMNRLPPAGDNSGMEKCIQTLAAMGADGVILNDAGIINKVKRSFPDLYIMASIGLSPLNFREVDFLNKAGADSVLLSEFLDINEIREIRKQCMVSLELFADGVREFGFTGKCIMSSYFFQKYSDGKITGSAKRGGTCSDICKSSFFCENQFENRNEAFRFRFEKYGISDKIRELSSITDIFKIHGGLLDEKEICDIIKGMKDLFENLTD
ncbi:MAG: U32 family peptidase [Firmicutes bacterium]|nr:U32 family peptidase [Bacillota bacterium]